MYTNQGRFGAVIPGKVIVSTQQIWWNDRRPSTFFSLALHCTWMGIKNTGVKYMLKKPHPQLSSGPFAYIEKKMAFTYLNAEMLS
jgi:hypothetical protein